MFNLDVKSCQAGSAKLLSHASQFEGDSGRGDQKVLHHSKEWQLFLKKLEGGKADVFSWDLVQD